MPDFSTGVLPLTNGLAKDESSLLSANTKTPELRGWRFPMSRCHLWDRQVIGERTTTTAISFFPETKASSTVFDGISVVGEDKESIETRPLNAEWSVNKNRSYQLYIYWTETGASKPTQYIPSSKRRPGEAESVTRSRVLEHLHSRLQDSCQDLASCPDLSMLFPIQFIHESSRCNERVLEGYLLAPDSSFQFSPIRIKNICDVPLAKFLKERMKSKEQMQLQVGYLSMDRCRRLLPLTSDDPQVVDMTMVGVWVSGLTELANPVVLATCYRFYRTKNLKDKATSNGAFLLLFYSQGDYAAKLYECKVDDGNADSAQFSLFKCRLLSGQLSKAKELKIKWKLDQSEHHTSTTEAKPSEKSSDLAVLNVLGQVKKPEDKHKRSELVLEEIPFSFQTGCEPLKKRTRNETVNVHCNVETSVSPKIKYPFQNRNILPEQLDGSLQRSHDAMESQTPGTTNALQEYSSLSNEDVHLKEKSSSLRTVSSVEEETFDIEGHVTYTLEEPCSGACASEADISFAGFSVESSPRSSLSDKSLTIPYGPSNTEVESFHPSSSQTDLKCEQLENELSSLKEQFNHMEAQFDELKTMLMEYRNSGSTRPNSSGGHPGTSKLDANSTSLAIVPHDQIASEASSRFDASMEHMEPCALHSRSPVPALNLSNLPINISVSSLRGSQMMPYRLELSGLDFEEYDEELERLTQKYLAK